MREIIDNTSSSLLSRPRSKKVLPKAHIEQPGWELGCAADINSYFTLESIFDVFYEKNVGKSWLKAEYFRCALGVSKQFAIYDALYRID